MYTPEQKKALLCAYFGEEKTGALEELEAMIYVVMLWNATWALMQIGFGDPDIDYPAMARWAFSKL